MYFTVRCLLRLLSFVAYFPNLSSNSLSTKRQSQLPAIQYQLHCSIHCSMLLSLCNLVDLVTSLCKIKLLQLSTKGTYAYVFNCTYMILISNFSPMFCMLHSVVYLKLLICLNKHCWLDFYLIYRSLPLSLTLSLPLSLSPSLSISLSLFGRRLGHIGRAAKFPDLSGDLPEI